MQNVVRCWMRWEVMCMAPHPGSIFASCRQFRQRLQGTSPFSHPGESSENVYTNQSSLHIHLPKIAISGAFNAKDLDE